MYGPSGCKTYLFNLRSRTTFLLALVPTSLTRSLLVALLALTVETAFVATAREVVRFNRRRFSQPEDTLS